RGAGRLVGPASGTPLLGGRARTRPWLVVIVGARATPLAVGVGPVRIALADHADDADDQRDTGGQRHDREVVDDRDAVVEEDLLHAQLLGHAVLRDLGAEQHQGQYQRGLHG